VVSLRLIHRLCPGFFRVFLTGIISVFFSGRVLLSRLEAEFAALGHVEAHLVSTKTALGFYQSQGWKSGGQGLNAHLGLQGRVMRKVLQVGR
jgi:hypothetical protein